jgi:hypothetical protein
MNNNTEKENPHRFIFTAREKGYNAIIDKDRIKYYSKLKCDGFDVLYSSPYRLSYIITEKLLRKIKLLKLNNQLKTGNVYKNILEFIELSKKETDDNIVDYYGRYDKWYSYDYEIDEINDKRNQMKYQNRYFNKLKK